MANIFNFMDFLNYLDYKPKFEEEKCVKHISPKAKCSICRDICHLEAISLNKRSISLLENCDICNECVAYCPTNALVDTGKTFLRYKEEAFVLCKKFETKDEKAKLYIGCLNFLNRKILLNMYKAGFRTINTSLDKCQECSRKNSIENEINRLNLILEKLNKEPMRLINKTVEELDEKLDTMKEKEAREEIDRRSFFKELFKETFSKAYQVAPPLAKDQFWENEIDILRKWETDQGESLSLYKVIRDENKCIECQSCVRLCPQKVWKIDGKDRITDLRLCHGCKLCEDICPSKAIKVIEELGLGSEFIERKDKKFCDKCSREFETYKQSSIVCPSCIAKEIKN